MEKESIFLLLKEIMKKNERNLHVLYDDSDNYYLETYPSFSNQKGEFFGAVQVKKSYISFHLMPVYYYPELLDNVPLDLKKHMQGKSCFNFKNIDKSLITALKKLVLNAYKKYVKTGKIKIHNHS